MRGILFILLGALSILPVAAAEGEETRWYDIELIVFAPNDDDFIDAEAWPEKPELPKTETAKALLPAPQQPPRTPGEVEPFQSLTPGERQLDGAYRRLKASSQFEPLVHLAWRQPGLKRGEALPVRVTTDTSDTAPEPAEADLPRLDGTVTIILSRYLHLETDLVYRIDAQVPETEIFQDPAVIELGAPRHSDRVLSREEILLDPGRSAAGSRYFEFVVNSSRRMRSKELHYLDNPVLGVIALITPYELPEAPTPPAEVEPTPANSGTIER